MTWLVSTKKIQGNANSQSSSAQRRNEEMIIHTCSFISWLITIDIAIINWCMCVVILTIFSSQITHLWVEPFDGAWYLIRSHCIELPAEEPINIPGRGGMSEGFRQDFFFPTSPLHIHR